MSDETEYILDELNQLREQFESIYQRVNELERQHETMEYDNREKFDDIYHNIDDLFERTG